MKGTLKVAALVVFLLTLTAAALFLPEQLSLLQEEPDELQTMELTYQPYEIQRYDTFAQKLEDLEKVRQNSLENGYELCSAIFEEGEIPDDSTLLSIANEELAALAESGALPQSLGEATAVLDKEFGEVYSLMPSGETQQNFYYYCIDFEVESGTISLQIDTEFHKVYAYSAHLPWDMESLADYWAQDDGQLVQGWTNYWGVTATVAQESADTDSDSDTESSVIGYSQNVFWRSPAFSLSSDAQLELSLYYYGFGEIGQLQAGLSEF